MKKRLSRFDAYYGETRITCICGTKRYIINRLKQILDINWVDSLIVTKENDFDAVLHDSHKVFNFFTEQELEELIPSLEVV